MNKLFALVLILALVGFASASTVFFQVEGDSGAGLVEGSSVTVNIVSDVKIGGISAADVLGIGTASAPVSGFAGFGQPMQSLGVLVNDGTTLIDGFNVSAPMDFMSGVEAGEMLFSFTYVVPEAVNGSFSLTLVAETITALDWSTPQTIAYSSDILPVPEPMTVMLLGLGGLFLRRRK